MAMKYKYLTILLLSITSSFGANVYIRASATGLADGTTWTDAKTDIPAILTRGDTYYVSGGIYGSHSFNDAQSGTTTITIKKATIADHGIATGWDNTFATQAVFSVPFSFTKGYYVIDGVSRSTWKTGYGFHFKNSGSDNANIKFRTCTNNVIRYCEIEGSYSRGDGPYDAGIDADQASGGGVSCPFTVSHCYIHDLNFCSFMMPGNNDCTIEYNYIARNTSANATGSTSVHHAEGISAGFCHRLIVRNNIFEDAEGTAFIATPSGGAYCTASDWEVYGNSMFFSATPRSVAQGPMYIFACNFTGHCYFYNNTMYNLQCLNLVGSICRNGETEYEASAGPFSGGHWGTYIHQLYVKNNVWYGSWVQGRPAPNGVVSIPVPDTAFGNTIAIDDFQFDKNIFINCTYSWDGSGVPIDSTSPLIVNGVSSPFTDGANGDFTLLSGTPSGVNLGSPYNIDPNGNIRGNDGVYDIGAYEYVANSGGGGGNPFTNGAATLRITVGNLRTQ